MYVSGPSLGEKKYITLYAGATPTLPPDNLFLNEPDGITRPFRIGVNTDPTSFKQLGIVDFELWAEFEDQPANITHIMLNDCTVSESATWSKRFYGAYVLDVNWPVTLDGDTASQQAQFIITPVGGTANTVDWQEDGLHLTDFVGNIYLDMTNVPGFVNDDWRYLETWRITNESGTAEWLPSAGHVRREEGTYTILLASNNSPYPAPPPPVGTSHIDLAVPTGPVGTTGGWTGVINGITLRKELDNVRTLDTPCIGSQTMGAFGHEVYNYTPERGSGAPYPINILHMLEQPSLVQAVIIKITDPDVTHFDAHNLHLAGGYTICTAPTLGLKPIVPKIKRNTSGYGVPEDGAIVRRWAVPLEYLTIDQSAELHRLMVFGASKPIVSLAFEDLPVNGTRQLWALFGYVEAVDLKASKGNQFSGTMTIAELRVSAN